MKEFRDLINRIDSLEQQSLQEADPPPQGSLASAIPGTPETLQPRPTRAQIIKSRQRARKLRKWMNG